MLCLEAEAHSVVLHGSLARRSLLRRRVHECIAQRLFLFVKPGSCDGPLSVLSPRSPDYDVRDSERLTVLFEITTEVTIHPSPEGSPHTSEEFRLQSPTHDLATHLGLAYVAYHGIVACARGSRSRRREGVGRGQLPDCGGYFTVQADWRLVCHSHCRARWPSTRVTEDMPHLCPLTYASHTTAGHSAGAFHCEAVLHLLLPATPTIGIAASCSHEKKPVRQVFGAHT